MVMLQRNLETGRRLKKDEIRDRCHVTGKHRRLAHFPCKWNAKQQYPLYLRIAMNKLTENATSFFPMG